jgi:hypothetical protein
MWGKPFTLLACNKVIKPLTLKCVTKLRQHLLRVEDTLNKQ